MQFLKDATQKAPTAVTGIGVVSKAATVRERHRAAAEGWGRGGGFRPPPQALVSKAKQSKAAALTGIQMESRCIHPPPPQNRCRKAHCHSSKTTGAIRSDNPSSHCLHSWALNTWCNMPVPRFLKHKPALLTKLVAAARSALHGSMRMGCRC